jgi:hypothetical protein
VEGGHFTKSPDKNSKTSVQESRKLDVCFCVLCRRRDTKSEWLHSTCQETQDVPFHLHQARSRMCFVIEKSDW